MKAKPARRRGRDLLGLLGLMELADVLPAKLSGGQRQRLAIARALANEPTGALDSAGSQEVLDLFTRLNESGQTIVMVTHDPAVASGAGRIVHLRDGFVVTGDLAPSGT